MIFGGINMLKLNRINEVKEYILNIDEYIPFSIEFSKSYSEFICFRFGNGDTSLLEIYVNKNTFEIYNITLVSINTMNVVLCNKEKIENNKIFDIGFPIITYDNSLIIGDISYFDCFYSDIKLFIGTQHLCVSMDESLTERYVQNNNVFFGFNVFGNLNSIIINNIPFDDIDIIKQSIL